MPLIEKKKKTTKNTSLKYTINTVSRNTKGVKKVMSNNKQENYDSDNVH